MSQPPSTALATKQKEHVLEVVQKGKAGFLDRLPTNIDRDRLWLGLVTLIQKRDDIAACDPSSIIIAGYEAAEIGINLNPALGLGYVVPYKGIAQFQLGYRGMIQKAYEYGVAKLIFAEVVYKGDHFKRVLAPTRKLEHEPPSGDRQEAVGAYSFVELRDGSQDFEYLTKEQIARHRNHSKNPDSLMWKTFWEEGWRKTPIRVHFKRLPLTSAGLERFAELVFKDSEKEFEFDASFPDAPTPEIRRAAPPEVTGSAETPKTGPDNPVNTPGASQASSQEAPKGRGKGKTAKAPEESLNTAPKPESEKPSPSAFPTDDEIAEIWKKLYGIGWGAYEVKRFLQKKGFEHGSFKQIPKAEIATLLSEMESGEIKS